MNKINACLEDCSVLLRTKPCQIAFALLYNYRRTTTYKYFGDSGPKEFLGNSNAATKCFNSFQTGEYQEIIKNIFCWRSEIEPFVNKEILSWLYWIPWIPPTDFIQFCFQVYRRFQCVLPDACQAMCKYCSHKVIFKSKSWEAAKSQGSSFYYFNIWISINSINQKIPYCEPCC